MSREEFDEMLLAPLDSDPAASGPGKFSDEQAAASFMSLLGAQGD